jgi:co-chaperonin GroES (HSP10)
LDLPILRVHDHRQDLLTKCQMIDDRQSRSIARMLLSRCSSHKPEGRPHHGAFQTLHDRVLLRRVEAEEKTPGGIIIPDTAKEKPIEGEVLAVGPGAHDETGRIIPLDVKAGSRAVRQVGRHGSADRRRTAADPQEIRHPGPNRRQEPRNRQGRLAGPKDCLEFGAPRPATGAIHVQPVTQWRCL